MENQLKQGGATNPHMTMEAFKTSLSGITPLIALQNFKEVIDQSITAGMHKNMESVLIITRSLEVLYEAIKTEPGAITKTEPKE